jgi:hypothetical protein
MGAARVMAILGPDAELAVQAEVIAVQDGREADHMAASSRPQSS